MFYTQDNFVLSPQNTISITVQMDTCVQFYLNALPVLACWPTMPLSGICILLNLGTNICNCSEGEIMIWPREVGFF